MSIAMGTILPTGFSAVVEATDAMLQPARVTIVGIALQQERC
jgi:microcompartment protein CcmL/EutN